MHVVSRWACYKNLLLNLVKAVTCGKASNFCGIFARLQ